MAKVYVSSTTELTAIAPDDAEMTALVSALA